MAVVVPAERRLLSGNEAIALGTIEAGLSLAGSARSRR